MKKIFIHLTLLMLAIFLISGCDHFNDNNITHKDYAYVINADGTNKTQIKWYGGFLKMTFALFNETGERIFIQYTGDDTCLIVSPEGDELGEIAEGELFTQQPTRIPGEDKLLVTSNVDRRIYTIDLQALSFTELISDQIDNDEQYYSSCSPNNEKIVYSAVNSDSTHFLRVYDRQTDSAFNLLSNGIGDKYLYPVFSPDGEWIYYTLLGAYPGMYKIKLDGSEWTQISYFYSLRPPLYTPDGVSMIFSSNGRIMKMNLASEEVEDICYGEFPSLSPDGTHIVFADTGNIRLIDIDGENIRNLAEGDLPFYSPSTEMIVFIDYR